MTLAAADRPEEQIVSHSLVEEAMRAFAKAFRAWQLYLPNNPARDRALTNARSALAACWISASDGIRLQVREAEFLFAGASVLRESERPSDGIPWILYRDGIRELSLLPGFELDEMGALFALLQRARQAAPDDDDLVTMLWVADLDHVSYRYVEIGSAYELSSLPSAAGGMGGAVDGASQEPLAAAVADGPGLSSEPPPELVRVEDFDSTLFFLDRRELAYLQDAVRGEFGSDPRRDVLAVLFDIIELQSDPQVRAEAIGNIDELLINLLSSATYELVAYALREAHVTQKRATGLDASLSARLLALSDRLSEPAVIAQLLQAVDEGTRAPGAETLEALVSELRGTALAPLLSWVTHSTHGPARASVERAVLRLAERNTAEVVRLVEDSDPAVALGAIRLCGRLRTSAAVSQLSRHLRAVHQTDSGTRVEIVQALDAIGSLGAMQALEVALDDPDRDVRVAAMRAVGARRHAGALNRLSAALRRKELRSADRSEKTALFDAFGAVCGDAGVPALDAVLNGRSLLGPRESGEMRACAARALGIVGSELAHAALRKAADARDAVVRNEVARAVRAASAG